MKNYSLKFKTFKKIKISIFDEKEKIVKIFTEIYSPGKSPDSPGGFGHERTRKINPKII
jgi:hypothetical protein